SLGQRRLAAAELAFEQHQARRPEFGGQLLSQGQGFLGRVGYDLKVMTEFACHLPLVTCHLSLVTVLWNARGTASTRSPAIIECCPSSAAARSPASPCKYTAPATTSMTGRLANWARRPAVSPVSTSPVPPVAMPGLPVGFTHTCPSGAAVRVRKPLRTRWTWYCD